MSNRSNRFFLPIIILLIVIVAVWVVWPGNPGVFGRSFDTRLGLDLVGGVQALLEADLPANTTIDQTAMDNAVKIVENRVNGLGVSEAVVQTAGNRRVIIELPGEKDPEKALETVKKTGLLEFVDFTQLTAEQVSQVEVLSQRTPLRTDYLVGSSSPVTSTEVTTNTLLTKVYHTVMGGKDLKSAVAARSQTGEYEVSFTLTSEGAQIFKDFTSANVGKPLAIVLDKKVISAPRINQPITDGSGVITGNFNNDSANELALQLRYGSLPVPLKVATSQTVGPTLGRDSLNRSLIAGIIGMLTVMIFMALYYRLPGLVANVALIIYALITFALFKLIPVTLTLPGIAGFVLSIGVAVDANILIFERMKEELRAGRTLIQAVDLGWKRAWTSIRDSNISTLITCGILFWFGSNFGASIVKGFSLTLALGVGVSLFTAVIVTRTLLHLVMDNLKASEHTSWFGI
jgi:preprotein translocase subunit SecD